MANQQLGDRITSALSECDDTILSVAQTLGQVLGMWIGVAARDVGGDPDQLRALVLVAADGAIADTLAEPRMFDA